MFTPIIFKLPKSNIINEFIKETDLIVQSKTMSQPLFSLGFHHFIIRTKNAMMITNKLETKNEFYYVVNSFEILISNYDNNINNLSKIYFNKNKINNFDKNFYIMWEISFIFDIIYDKKLTFIAMSENSENFLQSIIYFREKILNKDISKDNIYSVLINTQKDEDTKYIIQNYKLKTNIKNLKKEMNKTYSNLVILDNEKLWDNKSNQEQESYKLILEEIIYGLKILEENGSLILKIYDTFTIITIKLIWILSSFFEETYIYKPFFSRPSDSDKYVVCKKLLFNQTDKKFINALDNLEKILNSINNDNYLNNIIPTLSVPLEWLNIFKFINIKLVNIQQIIINNIVKYIKDNNYFGDKYHDYKNNQIEATDWWVSIFFPPSSNLYQINKEIINKLVEDTIIKNNFEIEKFNSQFIYD